MNGTLHGSSQNMIIFYKFDISFNFSYPREWGENYTSKQKMPLALASQVLLPAGRKSEMQQIYS